MAILRTDLDGLVTVSTDGKRLWFDQMAWQTEAAGGYAVLRYPIEGDLLH